MGARVLGLWDHGFSRYGRHGGGAAISGGNPHTKISYPPVKIGNNIGASRMAFEVTR